MLLCSFEIALCCLQVVLLLLPSPVSYLLIVGIIVIVIAAVAKSLSSYCCYLIAVLGGFSIRDYSCWSRGCSAFDNYRYSWLAHFARRQNYYQLGNYYYHDPLHKNRKISLFGYNLQWPLQVSLLLPTMLELLIEYRFHVLLRSSLLVPLLIVIDNDWMTSHQVALEPLLNFCSSMLH